MEGSLRSDGSTGNEENLCCDLTEETFTPHDVVLGKGNGINCLPGNQMFRSIINKYKPLYAKTPRNVKASVAELVLKDIAALEPPGRFLEPQADNKRFKEVPRKRAIEKTCQALREKKHGASSSLPNYQTDVLPFTGKTSLTTVATLSSDTTQQWKAPFQFQKDQTEQCTSSLSDEAAISMKLPSIGDDALDPPQNFQFTNSGTAKSNSEKSAYVNNISDAANERMGNDPLETKKTREEKSHESRNLTDINDSTASEPIDTATQRPVWPLMENDILYGGRGRKHFHRLANQRFLDLIKYSREAYEVSRSKKRVALGIITDWRHQTPTGRFLQQNPKDNKWYEISESKILEKTCQALRDMKRQRGPGGVRPTIADRMVDPRFTPPIPTEQVHPTSVLPNRQGIMPYFPPHVHPNHSLPPPNGHWNFPPPHPQSGPYQHPQSMLYAGSFMSQPHSSTAAVISHNASSHSAVSDGHVSSAMMYSNEFMPHLIPLNYPGQPHNNRHENNNHLLPYGNAFPPHRMPVTSHPSKLGNRSDNFFDGNGRSPTNNVVSGNVHPVHPNHTAKIVGTEHKPTSETKEPQIERSNLKEITTHDDDLSKSTSHAAVAEIQSEPSSIPPGKDTQENGEQHQGPIHMVYNKPSPIQAIPSISSPNADSGTSSPKILNQNDENDPTTNTSGNDKADTATATIGNSNNTHKSSDKNTKDIFSQQNSENHDLQTNNDSTYQDLSPDQPQSEAQHHEDSEAFAASQRQASIAAQEMQKMDELVRKASSSGAYVPQTGFGSSTPSTVQVPHHQTFISPSVSASSPSEDSKVSAVSLSGSANETVKQTSKEDESPTSKADPNNVSLVHVDVVVSKVSNGRNIQGPGPSRLPRTMLSNEPSRYSLDENHGGKEGRNRSKNDNDPTINENGSKNHNDAHPSNHGRTAGQDNCGKNNLNNMVNDPVESISEMKDDEQVKNAVSEKIEEELPSDPASNSIETPEREAPSELGQNEIEPSREGTRSGEKQEADKKNGGKDQKKNGDPRVRGELEAAALLANMFGN